jgi:Asp-tRNA(Asn)/Glu-tRNA(Gln) amidotransferase A subunit family amidase
MTDASWTIRGLREALAAETVRPVDLAEAALARANGNQSHNTYLWQNPAWTLAEAARAGAMPRGEGGPFGDGRSALWGLPISVKDCFDLAGAPTSCGVRYYRDMATESPRSDSWLVEKLRAAGAVIIGKTHMHPLAYGITGENPDFGDCLQPGNEGALTGGSSSGAAASVLEGSAVAALGTDTGGSIRAPAALCGLAGYRASLGRGNWQGGAHLAQSFDTMGWLFRDLEDAPLLARFPCARGCGFNRRPSTALPFWMKASCTTVNLRFLPSLHATISELEDARLARVKGSRQSGGTNLSRSMRPFRHGRQRASMPATLTSTNPAFASGLSGARASRLRKFQRCANAMQSSLPAWTNFSASAWFAADACSPVARLAAGADHSKTRGRILRYTTPFSMAGVPVVTLPCAVGGMQLAAARGCDESLVEFAALLGARRKSTAST